jgi:AcrR family transcriptional regulator
MKNIAADAGMTAGALYHHFTSKQDLFAAVYHRHLEESFQVLDAAAASPGTFFERISALLDAAADLHVNDPGLAAFTAVATIELQRHAELCAAVGGSVRTVYRFFERLLSEAQDEVAEQDRAAVVNLLVAMFTGLSVFAAGARAAATHRDTIEVFKRALAGTLLTRSPRP